MPIIKKQGDNSKPGRGNAVARIKHVEFTESDGFSLGIYGKAATGKTTTWATFPGKILAMVCASNGKPGELRSLNAEQKKRTKVCRIEHSDDILELCEYLNNGAGYSTVVLDHGSALQDIVMREVLNLEEIPVQKSWGMARQQDYGTIAIKMKSLLRKFLCVPGYRVVITQERIFGGGESEEDSEIISPSIGFGLLPSVAGFLAPELDYIVETFIRPKMATRMQKMGTATVPIKTRVKKPDGSDAVEYCCRTGPDSLYTTKFRVPKGSLLPSIIIDPDFDKISKIISG